MCIPERCRKAHHGSNGPNGLFSDRQAPRPAALEERVGVELVRPAEEVRLGTILRGAVDRGAGGLRCVGFERLATLDRIEARLRLFRDWAFLVATGHVRSLRRLASTQT